MEIKTWRQSSLRRAIVIALLVMKVLNPEKSLRWGISAAEIGRSKLGLNLAWMRSLGTLTVEQLLRSFIRRGNAFPVSRCKGLWLRNELNRGILLKWGSFNLCKKNGHMLWDELSWDAFSCLKDFCWLNDLLCWLKDLLCWLNNLLYWLKDISWL